MSYKCNSCGATFDQPKEVVETHGFDRPPYERWLVCPYCEDSDFDEIEEDEDI